jgi:hypothetical protein
LSSDRRLVKKAFIASCAAGWSSRRPTAAEMPSDVSKSPDAADDVNASSGVSFVRKYDSRDAIS